MTIINRLRLLKSALNDGNSVLFLEHRDIMRSRCDVPEESYSIEIGKGKICCTGENVTIIAISNMVSFALKAAEKLRKESIGCEVVDLRTIKPYDKELIINSVRKTGRVVIADTGWFTGGVAKEIAELIYYECFDCLKAAIEIVALPDVPTPASYKLEEIFYKTDLDVLDAVKKVMYEKRKD